MRHIEGTFNGIKDLKIYYQAWLPESPKAIVQFLHGATEHSGRFPHLVDELVANNYAIYADDHRGHGKSEGVRVHVDSITDYIEDKKLFLNIIKKNHPDLPIVMVGFSLGAVIAFAFTLKYETLLSGLVLVGITPNTNLGIFLRFLVRFFSKIRPHMRFGKPLAYTFLSRDPQVAVSYENDPLVANEPSTMRWNYEILKVARNIQKSKELSLPVMVQCGSDDRLLNRQFGQADEIEFNNLFKMEDKTLKIYQGLFHEIYNEIEPDRKIVLQDLVNWLDKHI
ncbi:MAG: alpha/beta hydrolase [Candidatus Helarchaeota archaeon]|nr:alpha/beta hydrolase [Candidatus Helarchaeota archaeon]